jgi:hypothetical protein
VLAASVDDERSQPLIQPFAEKNKIPFPLLLGATTDQMQQLQLGEVILRCGWPILSLAVLGELNKSDLQNRLEWMLGKHHGKAPPAFVNGLQKKQAPDSTPSVFSH